MWTGAPRRCTLARGRAVGTGLRPYRGPPHGTGKTGPGRSEGGALTADAKQAARERVWSALEAAKAARFPFPPQGRIPNFAGAEQAARRLFEHEPWRSARTLKINPDAPQRPVRRLALERGIRVLMPTPRLRAGFWLLDPDRIAPEERSAAASLSKVSDHAERCALDELPPIDAIVAGSVAVTRSGRRCGKGHGYADIEYGILRELGCEAVPVATTIHPLQWVESLPRDPTDLPLALICTPEESVRVRRPPRAPTGIDWSRVDDEMLDAMPVLAALRDRVRA